MIDISEEDVSKLMDKIGSEALFGRSGAGSSHVVRIKDIKIDEGIKITLARVDHHGMKKNRPSIEVIHFDSTSSYDERGLIIEGDTWFRRPFMIFHFDDDLIKAVIDGYSKFADKFPRDQGYVSSIDFIGDLIAQYKEGNLQVDELLRDFADQREKEEKAAAKAESLGAKDLVILFIFSLLFFLLYIVIQNAI